MRSEAPEMDSNTIQDDATTIASPNFNLNWSQREIEFSLDETFSNNLECYDTFEPLIGFSMHDIECLAPETLSMRTETELDSESYPPLSPVSLIPSVDSSCFASTFDAAADLATLSSISETQSQTSDDTSYRAATKTASVYDKTSMGNYPQNGVKSTFSEAKSSIPAIELSRPLITPSTKEKAVGATSPKRYSGMNRDEPYKTKRPRKSRKGPITKEQEALKRERFLERNRIAANKCRENRKIWINDLQEKFDRISTENALSKAALDEKTKETIQLKRIVVYLRRVCSVLSEMPPELRCSIGEQFETGDLV